MSEPTNNPQSAPNLRLVASDVPKPYEQLPNETEKAYAAFRAYMEMSPRSVRGLAVALNKSATLIGQWSSKHHWQERIRAWDNEQMRSSEQAAQKEAAERGRLWAQRKIQIKEDGYALGQSLMERAKQLLALPVFERDREYVSEVVETKDGRQVPIKTVLNFSQSPRDAIRMAEVGLKLLNVSAGLPTENFNFITDFNLDDLDDEQLEEYAAVVEKARTEALVNQAQKVVGAKQ